MRRIFGVGILLAFFLSTMALPAQATVIKSDTSGDLSATASFELVGSTLTVILTNISTADVVNPGQVLTALFFDATGTLTPVSAFLTTGSVVLFDTAVTDVGGEWAYGAGLSGAPLGAGRGISSAGFGLFGNANFVGPNLDDPLAIDGLNYGIVSAGDNPAIGNNKVTGMEPLIQSSVTFTLTASGGFTEASIDSVSFQYGTSLSDRTLVPEPGTVLLLGSGLVGVAAFGRRFRKQG